MKANSKSFGAIGTCADRALAPTGWNRKRLQPCGHRSLVPKDPKGGQLRYPPGALRFPSPWGQGKASPCPESAASGARSSASFISAGHRPAKAGFCHVQFLFHLLRHASYLRLFVDCNPVVKRKRKNAHDKTNTSIGSDSSRRDFFTTGDSNGKYTSQHKCSNYTNV